MKLNEDLQSYLSQSGSKSSNKLGSESLLKTSFELPKLWSNSSSNSTEINIDNSSSSNQNNGWFSNLKSRVTGSQPEQNTVISKLCGCCPTLGPRQRIVWFGMSLTIGILCFSLAAMNIPFLILRARKFALLFTMGSLATVCSIAFLVGPATYLTHFFSRDRLGFSSAYLGSLITTLYASMVLQSTIITVPFALVQVLALTWLLVSYIPGGQSGLRFISSIFTSAVKKSVSQTLPI